MQARVEQESGTDIRCCLVVRLPMRQRMILLMGAPETNNQSRSVIMSQQFVLSGWFLRQ